MLRFFRLIRKKLIEEDNMRKYFFYALGEILLVVIGILIALQINNWNNARLERIEERALLQNLKTDFQRDIKTFEQLNERRNQHLIANYGLIDIKNSNDFSNEVLIDSLIAITIPVPTYNGQSVALDVLFTSGKINLLRSDSLKNLLLQWPVELDDTMEMQVYLENIAFTNYYPLLRTYISLGDALDHHEFSQLGIRKGFYNVSKDYKGLFQNHEFVNLLRTFELFYQGSRRETNALTIRAEEIIRIIDEELDR